MADNFNNFNYDGDDIELDENGLPIYTDEDDDNNDTSSQDLMDMIRRARGEETEEDEDDENDDNSTSNSLKNRKQNNENSNDGGRYGDSTQPQNQLSSKASKPSTPTQGGGGSDWFSKFSGGGNSGANLGKVAGKMGGTSAGAAGAGASATGGALAAAAPYIGIALLIILAIILIVVIIVAVVAFFQAKTDPENMGTNEHVTNEYFYGIRTVYIDEPVLLNSLQLSYKQYAIDIIENFEETNPSIDITITLPVMEEGSILTNDTPVDQNITNLSLGIANIVATGSSSYSGIEFSTLYPQIEYFGLTTEQGELALEFVQNYIVDNNLYSSEESVNITELIETTITTDTDLQYIYNRCEKVMIKDELASSTGLTGIEQRQYIASIYMANKDIVIESASYTIASTNEIFNATSKLIEENNGSQTIHREKETKDNRDIISGFSAGKVNIKKFTSIDENNTSAFSNGLSLFSALRLSPDYINFFTLNQDGIYTWKPTSESLYYLTFDTETPFIFTDFSLNVKLP